VNNYFLNILPYTSFKRKEGNAYESNSEKQQAHLQTLQNNMPNPPQEISIERKDKKDRMPLAQQNSLLKWNKTRYLNTLEKKVKIHISN
jgi:hypothetical protein